MFHIILKEWPEASHQLNSIDELPIHFLCNNKELDDAAAFGILNLLLEMNPQLARETDDEGHLPIHLAAGSKYPEFCKILIDAYPESVRVRNGSGETPLHFASYSGRLDTVKYLCELCPESINAECSGGFLPIHDAARGGERAEIIRFLLSKYPDGAEKATDDEGRRLPLHLACNSFNARDVNLKTVQLLLDAYPEAIFIEDGEENSPLDIVKGRAKHYPDKSTVVSFLETQLDYARQARDTDTMQTLDENGWLPLHHALHNNASLGSIKLLVKGNPTAVRVDDYKGSFPLHIASEFSTVDVVQFLVERNDSHLNAFDGNNNSSLHCACHGGKYEW